jgi:methionine synthase II (cobalamin-independent)
VSQCGGTALNGPSRLAFLEFDTDRAGGFEPLRVLPKDKKQVVLGLVTSKSGQLEPKDEIKRRIDEATKYVSRLINFVCRRNAALRPRKRAMCWPRRSSGPSCA